MIIDPIADLLTRIRNGYNARLTEVSIPFSRIKSDILKVLKKNNYILSYEEAELSPGKKTLVVQLHDVRTTKYIPTFKRISKPGQRIYIGSKDIKKSKNGNGIYIVSTPKGIITGYEARSLNVGGELMCEVY